MMIAGDLRRKKCLDHLVLLYSWQDMMISREVSFTSPILQVCDMLATAVCLQ